MGNAKDIERNLVLKMFRKQLSLFKKGVGPKPDINQLISKSRYPTMVLIEQGIPVAEDRTWRGVRVSRKIQTPLPIKYKFETEIKSQPGFYILQYTHGIKFGRTKNMTSRMLSYSKPWCVTPVRKEFLYCPFNLAIDLELVIKREFLLSYTSDLGHEFFKGKTIEFLKPFIKTVTK